MPAWKFLFVLLAMAYVATVIDQAGSPLDGFLLVGVVSGMFAVLGVVVGAADARLSKRLLIAIVGGIGLSGTLLPRTDYNGWMLLLSGCRLAVVGGVFAWVRHSRGLVFTNRGPSAPFALGKLRLKHLFGFTAIVAMFLALVRFLKEYNGPGGDMFLIGMTVLVGAFAALVPLLAAIGTMGQQRITGGIPFALAILILAACLGSFSYSQTGNVRAGLLWSLNSIVEAVTVAGVLLVLRYRGYRLASLPPSSSTR